MPLKPVQVVLISNLENWLDAKHVPKEERQEYRKSDSFIIQFAPGVAVPPFFPLYLRSDTQVWKNVTMLYFQGNLTERNVALGVLSGQLRHEYSHANPSKAKLSALNQIAIEQLSDEDRQAKLAALYDLEEIDVLEEHLVYLRALRQKRLFEGEVAEKYIRDLNSRIVQAHTRVPVPGSPVR